MKSIRRIFVFVFLLITLNGCAYFQFPYDFNKPSLSLTDITLKKANLLEQVFVAELRIENPNDFELPIDDVEVTVALEGTTLGEGTSSQDFVIPPNGEALFKMKIRTNLLGNLMAIKKIIDSKPDGIHYELTGTIDIGLPLFIQDIHIKKSDVIAAPDFHR